jgi:hypothetical protein
MLIKKELMPFLKRSVNALARALGQPEEIHAAF